MTTRSTLAAALVAFGVVALSQAADEAPRLCGNGQASLMAVDSVSGECVRVSTTGGNLGTTSVPATLETEDAAITVDTDMAAALANQRLVGFTVRESAGSPAVATVVLRHDVAAGGCTGSAFAYIELAANTDRTHSYGDRGIAAASGVCADVLAGTVDVSVWTVVEAAP